MILLKTNFSKNSFDHKQIKRIGNIALYERQKTGTRKPHYEVIRIRNHNGFVIPGTNEKAPPAEYYPSAEKWGVDGFTHNDLNSAEIKFAEWIKEFQNHDNQ